MISKKLTEPKVLIYINGAILFVVMLACFIIFTLPTTVTIIPDNSFMRFEPYTIKVTTLLHEYIVLLPPWGDQITSFTVGDLSFNAVVKYPKYYVGILFIIVLSGVGLYFNSRLILILFSRFGSSPRVDADNYSNGQDEKEAAKCQILDTGGR